MLFASLYALLDGAAAVGFVDGAPHAVGHHVGVKNRAAVQMARRAAHGLDQRSGGAQEAFFIGIQDGDQRNFRQIQPFAQQIDADQHVVVRRGADRAESSCDRASTTSECR